MKTILVTTEFSAAALNACNYAADMAVATNADLTILHVYQLPVSYSEVPLLIPVEEIIGNVEKQMSLLKEELTGRTKGKLTITTEPRMGVSFSHELETICDEIRPYIVVMGSQGNSATERFVFGSHTIHAMKRITWPLITVPPTATYAGIKKIAFACDCNEVEETIPVNEITLLVHQFNAALHVLNIDNSENVSDEQLYESEVLKEMLQPVNPQYHFISRKNVDESIINFVEKNEMDMLIVLPKRHNVLMQLVKRSHSKQFILHCHVPVLSVHHQE
jgi:nucleotide-binding universal stress UspA family protein